MNSVKRLLLTAVIGILSVLTVGLAMGGLGQALAAPPTPRPSDVTVINDISEPVPVLPQGTTNVAGSVNVSNWPTSPLPVAQQGTVDVSGTVGLSSEGNTVGLSTSANTVKLDPAANTVSLDPTGSIAVSGTVGLSDNTVKLDPNANTVKLDSTGPMAVSGTVKIDSATPVAVAPQGTTNVAGSVSISNPTTNPVPVAQQGTASISGTVGLNPTQNTVKLDSNTNTVKVTNATGQALDVNVVGGGAGGSAQQPVQFTSRYTTNFTWTNAYQVPAGKRLKIEFVSVYAEADDLWPVVSMRTTVGGVEAEYWLPRLEAEWAQQESNSAAIWSRGKYRMSTQVAIFADEGTSVQSVGRCFGGGCGNPGFNVTFSGYLTDK